ncbi:MAG: hypothetical protein HQ541_08490 [Mariniphaga sp.]|nr:hypothetical protein [Mariniphaga sp.]
MDKIIVLIEKRYGPLDPSYSLILNFHPGSDPVTQPCKKNKTIKINLPDYVLNTKDLKAINQKKLQFAHEMVHTISPEDDTKELTYLEEGMAVVLSEEYANFYSNPPDKYLNARNLTNDLLKFDPEIILKVRTRNPNKTISELSVKMFQEVVQCIPTELLQKLLQKFNS